MYPKTFILLQQEGHLINACLTQGLTSLRRARVDRKGEVYAAFFQLSIGFERLMKVCLIIDHMARNHFAPPPVKVIKKLSHKLTVLFEELKKISLDGSTRPLDNVDANSIEWEMFDYLSQFANSTRYFNLDGLESGNPMISPLSHWRAILGRIIREDVRTQRVQRALGQAAYLSSKLAQSTVVIANNAHGKPMDVFDAVAEPILDELAAPHAVWHVVSLLKKIETLLCEINEFADQAARKEGRSEQPVPTMYEFFTFLYRDRAECLKKKSWP